MRKHLAAILFFLIGSLSLGTVPTHAVHAQGRGDTEAFPMHIGLHSGLQTGILRYNVFPYTGEFQSTMERSIVAGFTLGFPVSEVLRLQVDIAWGEQSWSAQHDGDPKIEILRTKRSSIEFPFMLQYHVPSLPIPLYIAGGPRVSLLVGGEDAFVVSYTGYSEREGKQTTRWNYRENTMGMAISGEIGLEPSFTSRLSMQVALRYTQPLGRAVDEDRFSLQELSIWRARVGVLLLL